MFEIELPDEEVNQMIFELATLLSWMMNVVVNAKFFFAWKVAGVDSAIHLRWVPN